MQIKNNKIHPTYTKAAIKQRLWREQQKLKKQKQEANTNERA